LLALLGAVEARAHGPWPAHAPAGTGQGALSVFGVKGGDVMAASCAAPPCSAGALSLNVPAELRAKTPSAEVVAIGGGRRAVVVSIDDGARSFRAVVVAPLGTGPAKILFSGLVGLTSGQPGERRGDVVRVLDAKSGARAVVVGQELESVSLCGRPTLLAPQQLNPKTLELQGAKLQRLTAQEIESARPAQVRRMTDEEASAAATGVLRALSASSAIGSPQAATDGDPETTWSEDRGAEGKGEFLVMRSPPETPISGLELTIRPKTRVLEGGAAPERLFIAGPRDVFSVTLHEDAWKTPGARYRVSFAQPLQGACLAVSLDSSFDKSPGAKVTLAEVRAVTEFDSSKLGELVATLAGGGQRAEAAKSVLIAMGAPSFEAIAKAFDGLDEGGRRVALDVMDAAPCEQSAPVYVTALTSKVEAQALHARDRLRRCGSAGGEVLAAALAKSDKTDKRLIPLLVTELAVTDPVRSVQALVPLIDEKTVLRRRLIRTALAQVARTARAESAVRAVLADPQTPPVALIDLLRALGDQAPRYQPESTAALARLQQGSPVFRTRYLLLGPSATLSRVSPEVDGAFRQTLGGDPHPNLRAAAFNLVSEPQRYQLELLKALGDDHVRVREASARALGKPEAAFASQPLTERLAKDQWPLVRAAAADALARHPAGPALDQPLAAALTDESPLVRARSIRALGDRRAAGVAARIRDRLIDEEEFSEVRAEAARALGTLCDAESADILAAFAKKLADPMASPDAQLIATGAVQSLGRLALPNLKDALAPLSSKKAPPQARRAAAAALEARDTCSKKR
jgi:HEAT repeat protein/mRNA-degrading endonuclease toxin of MazEF toxin-antitoxin module